MANQSSIPQFNWKRHYRRLPSRIEANLRKLGGQEIIVAAAKKYRASEIRGGVLRHLGITISNGVLSIPNEVIPPALVGRYSRWNLEGREEVRKDLPKTTRTCSWEAPDYGDWTIGSHEVSMTREVYQRKVHYGQQLGFGVEEILEESASDPVYTLKFSVLDVIEARSEGFNDRVLFNVNLLQENIGAADVYSAAAKRSEYLRQIQLTWQLLPPGERDKVVAQIVRGFRRVSEQERKTLLERYELLNRLKPSAWVVGTDGFRRYFGAQYLPNLVVFENLEYGNAVYIMYEDWEKLSKLSRTELLHMKNRTFDRIVHNKTCNRELLGLVRARIGQSRRR